MRREWRRERVGMVVRRSVLQAREDAGRQSGRGGDKREGKGPAAGSRLGFGGVVVSGVGPERRSEGGSGKGDDGEGRGGCRNDRDREKGRVPGGGGRVVVRWDGEERIARV